MSNQIEITSVYDLDAWLVEARVTTDSDINFPRSIFLWTLDDVGRLEDFRAIARVDEVAKYPLYDSTRSNNFGIRQVRYHVSRQRVQSDQDKDNVIIVLKSAFTLLLKGYEEATKEVTELYPS
jgi:hypothetical protein